MFVFKCGHSIIILPVYVDNKLLAGNDNALLNSIQKAISSHFKTSNLGTATWILGIQVTHNIAAGTLSINQSQYLKGILSRFGMSDCTPDSIPLPASKYYEPASLDEHATMASFPFLEVIGSFTYAVMGTHPDISTAMHSLSPFATSFSCMHINAVKHILRYLRGTLDHSILYTMGGGELVGYTNADWVNDTTNRHSISGFTFLYAGGAVFWMSKKQSTVAMLSTHAKYISAAEATKELIWLCRLLSEVGEGVSGPTMLYIDNHVANLLVHNPVNHSATKHIDVHYHFICESISDGLINLCLIGLNDMMADILTKPLISKIPKCSGALWRPPEDWEDWEFLEEIGPSGNSLELQMSPGAHFLQGAPEGSGELRSMYCIKEKRIFRIFISFHFTFIIILFILILFLALFFK